MIIDDTAEAEHYLQHLNYYRLAAYWRSFETDPDTHTFKPGTRFTDALNLYIFDRELRLLMLDAIERLEVSVRSQWAYQMAHRHGPHAHLDVSLAIDHSRWKSNLDILTAQVHRSEEDSIKHHKNTYAEPLPPVWAVCEVMTLGSLSRWYSSLKPMPTRRAIADAYGMDQRVLGSWLHHLSAVRNLCAHHCRLWNRDFIVTPQLPKNKPAGLAGQFRHGASRKLYNSLVILLHCMDVVAPRHHWRRRLKDLIARHAIPVADMDFPPGWEQLAIWRETQ